MAFNYVRRLDAVGTLYQEACVSHIDAKDEAERAKWERVYKAIKDGWPDLCTESVVPRVEQLRETPQ